MDPNANVGSLPSLAFDPADGHPAISYERLSTSELNFAWHNGSIWQSQIVDSGGFPIYQSSLAFNDFGTGFPSIAYSNEGQELYYIEDPPLLVPEPGSLCLVCVGVLIGLARRRTSAVV